MTRREFTHLLIVVGAGSAGSDAPARHDSLTQLTIRAPVSQFNESSLRVENTFRVGRDPVSRKSHPAGDAAPVGKQPRFNFQNRNANQQIGRWPDALSPILYQRRRTRCRAVEVGKNQHWTQVVGNLVQIMQVMPEIVATPEAQRFENLQTGRIIGNQTVSHRVR